MNTLRKICELLKWPFTFLLLALLLYALDQCQAMKQPRVSFLP